MPPKSLQAVKRSLCLGRYVSFVKGKRLDQVVAGLCVPNCPVDKFIGKPKEIPVGGGGGGGINYKKNFAIFFAPGDTFVFFVV